MIILDAQISPSLALWISSNFHLECYSANYLNLRYSEDNEIFMAGRAINGIVITKDDDFVTLLSRKGSPPKVIWLTCGNTSNKRLKEIFTTHLIQALDLLQSTDLVEITGR